MSTNSNSLTPARSIGFDRRRLMKFGVFLGAATAFESMFPTICRAASFVRVAGAAHDIGVGADGSVWVIGAIPVPPGNFAIWRWNEKTTGWDPVAGAGSRIAVDPRGNAWVTNATGNIFRYDGNSFQLMPGLAKEIGIGADGSVWAIGANPVPPGNFGIWRWNAKTMAWDAVVGAGICIAVDSKGNAWVTNATNNIFRYDGNSFQLMPGLAKDIGIGADGSVWAIGANVMSPPVPAGNFGIWRWNAKTTAWDPILGAGVCIAVDPKGNAWITNASLDIYRWLP